jgi:hypothetical protein
VVNEDVYQLDDGPMAVTVYAEFVSNDEGGRACSGGALYEGSGDDGAYVGTPMSTCSAQDGYEGLSAVLVFDTVELVFEGLMLPGDFPPRPERPAAESVHKPSSASQVPRTRAADTTLGRWELRVRGSRQPDHHPSTRHAERREPS